MRFKLCIFILGTTMLTGCALPSLPFFDNKQSLQGPTTLINQQDFSKIYLPSLLNPEIKHPKDEDSYVPGDIDKAFRSFNKEMDKCTKTNIKGVVIQSALECKNNQKLRRNRIQERLLAASEQRCGEYQMFLKKYDSEFNFLMGTLTTATAAAGAIVTGGGSNILAGVASAFSGIRAEGNDAVLASKAVEIITNGMDLKRENIYKQMLVDREKELRDYPVERAIKDAITYHSNCSLIAGLEQAENSIERERNPGLKNFLENMKNLKTAFKETPEAKEMLNKMTK